MKIKKRYLIPLTFIIGLFIWEKNEEYFFFFGDRIIWDENIPQLHNQKIELYGDYSYVPYSYEKLSRSSAIQELKEEHGIGNYLMDSDSATWFTEPRPGSIEVAPNRFTIMGSFWHRNNMILSGFVGNSHEIVLRDHTGKLSAASFIKLKNSDHPELRDLEGINEYPE